MQVKILVAESFRRTGFTALCVLTAIGLAFAAQLRWHYGVPWTASIFWGLSDWYLWGILGVFMAFTARYMEQAQVDRGTRVVFMFLAAPVIISLHVVLTILVGTLIEPVQVGYLETFRALFSKKLTLNIVTFVTLSLIVQILVKRNRSSGRAILAKRGDVSRWLHPDQIITAEALGNYVKLNTDDGHWLIRNTLGNTEQLLGEDFLRISRFQVVNLSHIKSFREDSPHLILMLADDCEIRVAKRKRTEVRQKLQEGSQIATR